jgi:hypothetical protein
MENKYSKGAEWRKWDLHLHTPSSYDYDDKNVIDNEIIDALAANEISVAAITDHHVMDVVRIKIFKVLATQRRLLFFQVLKFCRMHVAPNLSTS